MPSSKKRKSKLRKIWNFIWHEDSVLSWVVNIIIAFVLVKFVIYPGMGLLLHTTHPVVAVVSGSMEHNGNFNEWWQSQHTWYESNGFTKQDTESWNFRNGFNKGDIMVLKGVDINNIKVGEVIVFNGNSIDPIIHRVVKISKQNNIIYIQTKGDHNKDSYSALGELNIPKNRIVGRAVFRIPWLGWIKIGAVDFINMFKGA